MDKGKGMEGELILRSGQQFKIVLPICSVALLHMMMTYVHFKGLIINEAHGRYHARNTLAYLK